MENQFSKGWKIDFLTEIGLNRTNRALRRLTSEVGRDPVHSTRYGRQQMVASAAAGRPAHLVEHAFSKREVVGFNPTAACFNKQRDSPEMRN